MSRYLSLYIFHLCVGLRVGFECESSSAPPPPSQIGKRMMKEEDKKRQKKKVARWWYQLMMDLFFSFPRERANKTAPIHSAAVDSKKKGAPRIIKFSSIKKYIENIHTHTYSFHLSLSFKFEYFVRGCDYLTPSKKKKKNPGGGDVTFFFPPKMPRVRSSRSRVFDRTHNN